MYSPSSMVSLRYRSSTTTLNASSVVGGSFNVPGRQLGKGRGMAREWLENPLPITVDFSSVAVPCPTRSLLFPWCIRRLCFLPPLSTMNPPILLSQVYHSPIPNWSLTINEVLSQRLYSSPLQHIQHCHLCLKLIFSCFYQSMLTVVALSVSCQVFRHFINLLNVLLNNPVTHQTLKYILI